jgi:hypothetical protein
MVAKEEEQMSSSAYRNGPTVGVGQHSTTQHSTTQHSTAGVGRHSRVGEHAESGRSLCMAAK